MALEHTGSSGFEGLVRDLLSEVTGQRFRLMKSGPQGGVDAEGESLGSGLVIGMEGKHYGAKTPLGLDALKSKLRDAAASFPAMDVWVLATTRQIDAGDTRALEEIGAELGVDVLVLDWDATGALPPSLAVLCAVGSVSVAHHLAASSGLAADIAAVRQHPLFSSEHARLRSRLTSPSVGIDAARSFMRAWITDRLRSTISARVAFESHANLEEPGVNRIARPNIDTALDGWWASQTPTLLALLGEEGVGKTWAILGWWLSAVVRDPDFPLTVVIPARDVSSVDPVLLVAKALHRATNARTEEFWCRRLRRWCSIESDRPILLVVLDGLNQNWSFTGWADLALRFSAPEWAGKAVVAMTCRPDHWNNRLKGLSDPHLSITTVAVARFDDAELDALLTAYSLERKEFSEGLIALMRVPRLCHLAIARRNELQESEDITPERLIYEDWRHRIPRAQQTLSHQEFKAFVADLGRRALKDLDNSTLSRAEILTRLTAESGLPTQHFEGVLSEVIDGGWLAPTASPHQFKLHADRLPDALGLTLAQDLRGTESLEEAANAIGILFDPLQGLDVSVAILRSAATFALLDPEVPIYARKALLLQWLGSQNFSPADFETYWRLIGCSPALFIEVAEDAWFHDEGSSRQGEVLVKGFANAWKWPDVAQQLEGRLVAWFSRYWLDLFEGEVLGQVTQDEHAANRRAETVKRVATCEAEGVASQYGLTLEEVDPRRQAWGCYRAVELLSWLPRAPLIQVYTAWALTRAILGKNRQVGPMGWVLRWNPVDATEAEQVILTRAEELLSSDGPISKHAGQSLLEVIATSSAMRLWDSNFDQEASESRPLLWRDIPPVYAARYKENPLEEVRFLDADPHDPALELPTPFTDRLRRLAGEVSDTKLLNEKLRDGDGGVASATLALARWAPETLAHLERRRFNAAINPAPAVQVGIWRKCLDLLFGPRAAPFKVPGLARQLPSKTLVLAEEDLAPWRALSKEAREKAIHCIFVLHFIELADVSAADQIAVLSDIPNDPPLPLWTKRLFKSLGPEDFTTLAAKLDSAAAKDVLKFWLSYLLAVPTENMPSGWDGLGKLIAHSDPDIRSLTLQLIWRWQNVGLADQFEQSGWCFSAEMPREEGGYGSLILTLCSKAASEEVIDRVHPEALGILVGEFPNSIAYLDAFSNYVKSELNFLATSRSRSYPRAIFNRDDGWDVLAKTSPEALREWMAPFLGNDKRSTAPLFFMAEEFPLLHALDALESIVPGGKADFITRALKDSQSSSMRSGDLYGWATRLPGPAGEDARKLALEEANNDKKLFEFAEGLQDNNQADWLIGQIRSDLGGTSSGLVARGVTLAGFLVPCAVADELWRTDLSNAPASGWLTDVYRCAKGRYERYGWSEHWGDLFRNDQDDDRAYAAFELFLSTLDARLYIGARRPSLEELASWTWRRKLHWGIRWDEVKEAVKKKHSEWEKTFLCSELPLQNQVPRRT